METSSARAAVAPTAFVHPHTVSSALQESGLRSIIEKILCEI